MSVHDLWEGLSKEEIKDKRKRNVARWQRRWRGPERNPKTNKLIGHKQNYKEHQKVQADLDDAKQRGNPKAMSISASSVTVDTLLDRHLGTKADRAEGTIEDAYQRAKHVRLAFGDRAVSTLNPTEIETWSVRQGVAAESRKKHLEILRASIKRGIRDGLVDNDPTEGISVALGHQERPYWTSAELIPVLHGARDDFDRALLGLQGLMGLRNGEARSLKVHHLLSSKGLKVINGGGAADRTKTRDSMRTLPWSETVEPWVDAIASGKSKSDWLFESPRKPGQPVGKGYTTAALSRTVAEVNQGRQEPIQRLSAHGLRHTFAAISLGELKADIISVSKAMGHARPTITLDKYGHLIDKGLDVLMGGMDGIFNSYAEAA